MPDFPSSTKFSKRFSFTYCPWPVSDFFKELPNLILTLSASAEYKQYRARAGIFLAEKWDPF